MRAAFPGIECTANGNRQLRLACIGDSITAGTVLPDPSLQSYPAVLGSLLGPGCEVRNFGCSGATVGSRGDGALPYRGQPQHHAALDWKPQAAVVMLGTNDSKEAVFAAGFDWFVGDYLEILNDLRRLPERPSILVVCPVPVVGEGNFNIREENRLRLIPKIREATGRMGLVCVDLDPVFAGHPEWLPDRVHPHAGATAVLAQAVAYHIFGESPEKF